MWRTEVDNNLFVNKAGLRQLFGEGDAALHHLSRLVADEDAFFDGLPGMTLDEAVDVEVE